MKMTPEEAINAATINGAFYMNDEVKSITKGKTSKSILKKYLQNGDFYSLLLGSNLIDEVYINGNKF
jgi:imidazolonepropionase